MDRLALKMGRSLSGSLVVRGLHFDADIGVLRVFLKPSVADIEFAMIGPRAALKTRETKPNWHSVWRGRRRRVEECELRAICYRFSG